MTYDVVIIGGGPAGLTAAIYASRARMKTLLIESIATPGQAVTTSDIENYPGFTEGLNGFELIERFKKQAENFGTEFKTGDVKGVEGRKWDDSIAWRIESEREEFLSLSVIIATGARPKKLDLPGEDRLKGKGVSYCAVCDGAFFSNKNIAVIGGGDTAVEEALFLTKFADRVTLVHRRDRLRATKILQERAFANKKIEVLWDCVASEILGSDKVEALKIKNLKDGRESDLSCEGVFVFIGYTPNTSFLKGIVKLDEWGYVITDHDMKTSRDGIFACGDARKKLLRQIVTACGDGATAAFSAEGYVEHLKAGRV
ncbi:MAG: thioredoxin-disulfide reductase [Omnitrophica bacterium RBG_13_46_9]|nr:MAG: thioredoxin-disulfide reductase [Omnitrophica bacterium RBG_13_46_9]